MLLASRQNMAPPRKAKKGHRVMGLTISGAKMLATSSFMLCCTYPKTLISVGHQINYSNIQKNKVIISFVMVETQGHNSVFSMI